MDTNSALRTHNVIIAYTRTWQRWSHVVTFLSSLINNPVPDGAACYAAPITFLHFSINTTHSPPSTTLSSWILWGRHGFLSCIL